MSESAPFVPRESIKQGDLFWSQRFGMLIVIVYNNDSELRYITQEGKVHTLKWDPREARLSFPYIRSESMIDSLQYGLRWFVKYEYETVKVDSRGYVRVEGN